jgi:hypothetical protein
MGPAWGILGLCAASIAKEPALAYAKDWVRSIRNNYAQGRADLFFNFRWAVLFIARLDIRTFSFA